MAANENYYHLRASEESSILYAQLVSETGIGEKILEFYNSKGFVLLCKSMEGLPAQVCNERIRRLNPAETEAMRLAFVKADLHRFRRT